MKHYFRYRETYLTIVCDDSLVRAAEEAVFEVREIVETKIAEDPFFGITSDPHPVSNRDDRVIRRMCEASVKAGVGPMAGIAGTVAEYVATRLVELGSSEAVIENGGDIAFYSPKGRSVGIFADHPVFNNLAFELVSDRIIGICSSSKRIGPSVSLGESNVSTVLSDNVVLADCCATALGNLVKGEGSLAESCERIGGVEGVTGCLACCGDKIAMFGDLPELIRADCSRLVNSDK